MRVGIHLPRPLREYSIDFAGCAAAMARAGHEPVLICRGAEAPFAGEIAECGEEEEVCAEFWRGLRLDRAIFFNWLKRPRVLRAAREAGIFVVTRADSDGLVSAKVFPEALHRRLVDPARNPVDFLRRWRHFLNWRLFHWRAHDAEILEIFELSDRIAVETRAALENFLRFLEFHGRLGLAGRFAIVPHAVPDFFLETPVSRETRMGIFCSGRWNDDQKDPALLERSIPRILDRLPACDVLIAGFGVEQAFHRLGRRHGRVRLLGLVDRRQLPGILAGCRFLLSSSRWESHPIGALEALCCGCSVASTPTPGFLDIVQGGRFGSLSATHSPDSLVAAAEAEWLHWENGERNPEEISSHWRPKVSNKEVANQLLCL